MEALMVSRLFPCPPGGRPRATSQPSHRTEASSTWLHLLGQHRQQMQKASPTRLGPSFWVRRELGW